jgi:anti-anti-sigma factor
MDVNINSTTERIVIRLRGRFDFSAHRSFSDGMEQALTAPSRDIQVDLADVDYIDSSALGTLLVAQDRAKAAGKSISLARAKGTVQQVLEIANFHKRFTIV